MQNNIIIVGDSFCANKDLWPKQVADYLNLNLIHFGKGGCHWWSYKKFIDDLNENIKDKTEVIVFCHTWTGRLPTNNLKLHSYNTSNLDTKDEYQQAVNLYFKHIHEQDYAQWAETKWFQEISHLFKNSKIINLFCFPWTINNQTSLKGMNVSPSLAAISLNEINASKFDLFYDNRKNHFSSENNKILGEILIDLIDSYEEKNVMMDTSKFNLLTKKWFDWK